MYELTEEIEFLYHSTDLEYVESIEQNGLKTDDNGLVYLSEKPMQYYDVCYRVTIPKQHNLVDWREMWYDQDGKEIDMDHQYDETNPYYVYMDTIPPQYLDRLSKEEIEKLL